jgi:hypothetical protein
LFEDSFPNYGQGLFELCKLEFGNWGIEAVEAKSGETYPSDLELIEGIGEVMQSCHFFLAVLSPKEFDLPMDDQPLSYWYYLEYGMALMHHGCLEKYFVSVEPIPFVKLPVAVRKRVIPQFPKGRDDIFVAHIKDIARLILERWENRYA